VHLDHAGGSGALLAALPHARLVVHPLGARHLIDPTKLIAGAAAVYGADEVQRSIGTVLPVSAERVVGSTMAQVFAAGLVGPVVLILAIWLFFGMEALADVFFVIALLVLAIATGTVLTVTANLHMKHRFFPRQMDRTMSHALPFTLSYMVILIAYMLLTVLVLLEEPYALYLMAVSTVAILVLGAKGSLYFYHTMSIFR